MESYFVSFTKEAITPQERTDGIEYILKITNEYKMNVYTSLMAIEFFDLLSFKMKENDTVPFLCVYLAYLFRGMTNSKFLNSPEYNKYEKDLLLLNFELLASIKGPIYRPTAMRCLSLFLQRNCTSFEENMILLGYLKQKVLSCQEICELVSPLLPEDKRSLFSSFVENEIKQTSTNSFYRKDIPEKRDSFLGEGVHGKVYSYYLEEEKKYMALKIYDIIDDSEELNAIREIALLSSVSHPSIVPFFGWSYTPELQKVYLYLGQGHQIPVKDLSEKWLQQYGYEVLRAIDYLHQRGFVHRDLKRENIIYSHDRKHVWLIDFGLTREEQAHGMTAQMAPPILMPPEMLENLDYDASIDIWQLGCFFAGSISGEDYFLTPRNDTELLYQLFYFKNNLLIHEFDYKPLYRLSNIVNLTLRDFIARCLTDYYLQRPKSRELLSHPFFQSTIPKKSLDNI